MLQVQQRQFLAHRCKQQLLPSLGARAIRTALVTFAGSKTTASPHCSLWSSECDRAEPWTPRLLTSRCLGSLTSWQADMKEHITLYAQFAHTPLRGISMKHVGQTFPRRSSDGACGLRAVAGRVLAGGVVFVLALRVGAGFASRWRTVRRRRSGSSVGSAPSGTSAPKCS